MSSPIVRYRRDSAGIEQLLMGRPMSDHMVQVAQAGVAVFESIAPRKSGRYSESARVIGTISATPSPRQTAALVVDVPYALAVEKNHHTLARVADALEAGTRG